VERFTAGQSFLRSAHALLVMTARFERSFWRYRDDGAYASLLLDAGHLSQTLYLVCTELGLGAFVTASLNTANIDERLGLDPTSEGAIAACGCGRPELTRPGLELDYAPYVPRRS
jgi:SagB-type dehydrogenase family enzyme